MRNDPKRIAAEDLAQNEWIRHVYTEVRKIREVVYFLFALFIVLNLVGLGLLLDAIFSGEDESRLTPRQQEERYCAEHPDQC